jgi:hypothetical protein
MPTLGHIGECDNPGTAMGPDGPVSAAVHSITTGRFGFVEAFIGTTDEIGQVSVAARIRV